MNLAERLALNHFNVDLCRLFAAELDSLYSLALLLTSDATAAESCLLAALDKCLASSRTQETSAASWSRWNVITEAAAFLAANDWRANSNPGTTELPIRNRQLAAIANLPAYERFVFVVSVLERFSVKECAGLLGCGSRDLVQARVQAMQRLATDLNPLPADSRTPLPVPAMVVAA